MTRYTRADLSRVRTISVGARHSKVRPADFAAPFDADRDSFSAFVRGLPRILKAADLRTLVQDIRVSRLRGKPVIVMIGAHVIKVGLAPVLIGMMEEGTISALALTGAGAIHDW